MTTLILQMKELRNYGDDISREITSRGVEGSLSQQRYFEDLMKLVRDGILITQVMTDSPLSLSPFQLGDLYQNDPNDLCLEFWSASRDSEPRAVSMRYMYTTCTCTCCGQ